MTDNVTADPGSDGATFRTLYDGTAEWPVNVVSYVVSGSAGAWVLQTVDATHGLPVSVVGTVAVDGSGSTQPISAASLPLPTGAATAAKQPALGIAGTASADVLSVQGIASMTPLLVDGSSHTQPVSIAAAVTVAQATAASLNATVVGTGAFVVQAEQSGSWSATVSGTVTANIGTTNGLALDATLTGGTAKTQLYDGTQVIGTSAHPVQVSLANTAANGTAVKVDASGATVPISGTFWQATQPVSASTLPLPTGAATSAKQPALGTAGTAATDVITVQGIASMTALKVDGSAVTQPVSAASLPLPTGASTAAKQPALGTAGSASADVITVQGVASMTALKVDGSAVTQPVSVASTLNVSETPAASNGLSLYRRLSTADTNLDTVKASAGRLYSGYVSNTNASPRFVKIYDKASNPVLASDTPKWTVMVPGNSSGVAGSVKFHGLQFSNGIAISITGAVGDTDTTAISANEVIVNLGYK